MSKGKPIIFDAESIRAIRDGRKTQTRRVVKPPEMHADHGEPRWNEAYTDGPANDQYLHLPFYVGDFHDSTQRCECPYGRVGDLVWVKESWESVANIRDGGCSMPKRLWRSPIYMPRLASRLTLELTDVRVQRVQEISDGDCTAEGVWWQDMPRGQQKKVERSRFRQQFNGRPDLVNDTAFAKRAAFEVRWDAINAKRGYPLESNPWVWALTFTPILKNIDQVLTAKSV